jgi:lipopolysaccharide export system protein LptA
MFQGPNTKSIVSGQVKIVQGTILVTGDTAELYAGPDSHIARVVVKGRKAHVEQKDDKGQLLKADADRVDYDLTTGRAVLTGSASYQSWLHDHYCAKGHLQHRRLNLSGGGERA